MPPAVNEPREYVVYIGGAGSRTITLAQWRQAGVVHPDAKLIQWDATNGYRLPRSDLDFLTEDEFNRYIRDDGKFAVITT